MAPTTVIGLGLIPQAPHHVTQYFKEGELMPQQELEAEIAAFEARVGLVEDIAEIRKLVASYEEYLDSLLRLDELRPLFTEAAKSVAFLATRRQRDPAGAYEAKEGLRRLFLQMNPTNIAHCAHLVTGPIITVDGEKAKGRWYLLCSFTSLTPEGPLALWEQGT